MIENYEDDTVDAPTRQPDTQQFRYFGSLLLRQGGEVGYHGYNHQPLVLPDTDYKDLYSYRQWPGEDAIVAAMDELIAFQKIVLPHTDGSGLCAALQHSLGCRAAGAGQQSAADPHHCQHLF